MSDHWFKFVLGLVLAFCVRLPHKLLRKESLLFHLLVNVSMTLRVVGLALVLVRDLLAPPAEVARETAKAMGLVAKLGEAVLSASAENETVVLSSVDADGKGSESRLGKGNANAAAQGFGVPGASVRAGVIPNAAASGAAGRRLQGCSTAGVQFTQFFKSNPYSWANASFGLNGEIASNATVSSLLVTQCGVAVDISSGVEVAVALPGQAAPFDVPTCVIFDEGSLEWVAKNVSLVSVDTNTMVATCETTSNGAYAIYYRQQLPEQPEGSPYLALALAVPLVLLGSGLAGGAIYYMRKQAIENRILKSKKKVHPIEDSKELHEVITEDPPGGPDADNSGRHADDPNAVPGAPMVAFEAPSAITALRRQSYGEVQHPPLPRQPTTGLDRAREDRPRLDLETGWTLPSALEPESPESPEHPSMPEPSEPQQSGLGSMTEPAPSQTLLPPIPLPSHEAHDRVHIQPARIIRSRSNSRVSSAERSQQPELPGAMPGGESPESPPVHTQARRSRSREPATTVRLVRRSNASSSAAGAASTAPAAPSDAGSAPSTASATVRVQGRVEKPKIYATARVVASRSTSPAKGARRASSEAPPQHQAFSLSPERRASQESTAVGSEAASSNAGSSVVRAVARRVRPSSTDGRAHHCVAKLKKTDATLSPIVSPQASLVSLPVLLKASGSVSLTSTLD
ncbi:unnamed protein product [Effrenium voratum]|nr:unnamed protein product [Effrenium voratum]